LCTGDSEYSNLLFKYKDGKVLEFETRGRFTMMNRAMVFISVTFYGTDGYLELDIDTKAFRKQEEPFAGSKSRSTKVNDPIPAARQELNILQTSRMRSVRVRTKHCIARSKRVIIHPHSLFLQMFLTSWGEN
jgi:hypothetical protein